MQIRYKNAPRRALRPRIVGVAKASASTTTGTQPIRHRTYDPEHLGRRRAG